MGYDQLGIHPAIAVVFFLVSIAFSISLHEMMHAWTGSLLGDDTAKEQGRITINPVAHVDPFLTVLLPLVLFLIGLPMLGAAKPVPFNPARLKFYEYGMALVALAGPLTNLVLAVIGAVIYNLVLPDSANVYLEVFILIFTYLNVAFFAFNIIPIPPLDGSRVLYVFMPDGVRDWMNMIERYGFILVMLLVFMGSSLIVAYFEFLIHDVFRL